MDIILEGINSCIIINIKDEYGNCDVWYALNNDRIFLGGDVIDKVAKNIEAVLKCHFIAKLTWIIDDNTYHPFMVMSSSYRIFLICYLEDNYEIAFTETDGMRICGYIRLNLSQCQCWVESLEKVRIFKNWSAERRRHYSTIAKG